MKLPLLDEAQFAQLAVSAAIAGTDAVKAMPKIKAVFFFILLSFLKALKLMLIKH